MSYDKNAVQVEAKLLDRDVLRETIFCGDRACCPRYIAVQEDTGEILHIVEDRFTGHLVALPPTMDPAGCPAMPDDATYATSYPVAVPGAVFYHYKGGTYRWLGLAARADDGTLLVIYRSELKGSFWARRIDDWYALVSVDGTMFTRFRPTKEESS